MNETPEAAIRHLAAKELRDGFKVEALHAYRDADNNIVYYRIRLKHPDGRKWIRPMHLNGRAYERGEPSFANGKLLYHLPDLLARPTDPVWFAEGENKVDALQCLGVLATTSGGSTSANHNDFSPLANRCVIIWPDNDAPGLRHAQEVGDLLIERGATVQLVEVSKLDLPPKGDVVDWLKVHPNATAENLNNLRLVDYVKTDPGAGDTQERPRKSQATRLVELVEDVSLFYCEDEAYANIQIDSHIETWMLRSKRFRNYLTRQYYLAERQAPSAQVVEDALRTLSGKALFECHSYAVYRRIANFEGNIYIDLCDSEWRAIEVTPEGWQITAESPVRFIRSRGMHALPIPNAGGSIDTLWRYLNVEDEPTRRLVVAWLVAALRPQGPYPPLVLQGEQGTGKSTAAKVLRALVDPSAAPLRAAPRDERDLIISARNSWCIALDNLSGLCPWLSDALCRIATEGGYSTRELFSDTDEVLIAVQRPAILNGIDDIATRQDLIDRSIILNLEPVPDNKRKSEDEFWGAFENDKPALLGVLLERVSRALRELPNTHLDKPPRMADFAKWATAAEPQDEKGEFIKAYRGNRSAATEAGLEGSPVAVALQAMISARKEWEGTATELLLALPAHADEGTRSVRSWPKSARGLSSQLRRLATALRMVGIEIVFPTSHSQGRKLRIFASQPSQPSQRQQKQSPEWDAKRDASIGRDANDSVASCCIDKEWDAKDAWDAKLHPFSNRNRPQWTQPDFEFIPNVPEGIAWHNRKT